MVKDYRVKVTVKNNRLASLLEERGWTVADLVRATGMSAGPIYDIVNLAVPGRHRHTGEWRKAVVRISEVLHRLPEDIIPPQHEYDELPTNTTTKELSLEEVQGMLPNAEAAPLELAVHSAIASEDFTKVLEEVFADRPRLLFVLRRRYGIEDGRVWKYREIGAELGLSVMRIRQIEANAIKLLRQQITYRGDNSKRLLSAADGFGMNPRWQG